MEYDYDKLIGDTKALKEKYSAAKLYKIGKSLMGRDILCVQIGGGHKKLIALGAFHSLEYLTAAFLMRFAERYSEAAEGKKIFFGRDAALLAKNISLYIVPMVNPDGVDIAVNGIDRGNVYHKKLLNKVGDLDFERVWQANACGVDINHNFDADWDRIERGVAPSRYGGKYAHSEAETKAVVNFIRRERFDMLIAFHSQGEEIYYDFNGLTAPRSKEIAEKMARESRYKVCVPEGTAVFGGCKDWFIKEFGREGFTVEMGRGKNPLPVSMLSTVYEPCARILLCGMEECLR